MKTSIKHKKYGISTLVFIAFIYLHSIRYFNYVNYNPTYGGWVDKLIVIILGIMIFRSIWFSGNNTIKKYAYGFVLIPMLSIIPCYLEHDQSIFTSINGYFPLFILPFLYTYLHKNKIELDDVVKIITFFAIVRTGILLVEQFTYPSYLFAFRPERVDDYGVIKTIEVRSGIYRYYLSDSYLSMFLIFYWGQRVIEKFNIKALLIFVWGLFGLWLDQTRQFMLVGYGAYLIVLLLSRYKKKIHVIAAVIAGILIVLLNSNALFGDLTSKTVEQTNEDNIRLVSYSYFFNDYWGGPFSVIFGNGKAAGNSSYRQEISNLADSGLYRSDIGIVGVLNQYGIATVLLFFVFYLVYVRKNWRYFDLYIKMFFLATLMDIPLVVFLVNNFDWYVFWAFMMYLCDLSVKKNMQITECGAY